MRGAELLLRRQTYDTANQAFKFAWDVAPWPAGPVMDYEPERVAGKRGETIGWRLSSGRVVPPKTMIWLEGTEGKGKFRLRGCGATGIGYCMSVATSHREEAWLLLKFLVSPEAQKIRSGYELKVGTDPDTGKDRYEMLPGPNMPSRMSLEKFYLDLGRANRIRPTFSGSLAGKNSQPLWPRIDVFIDARAYGRPATGTLAQEEIGRELDRQFQRMLLNPPISPEEVARQTRARADKIYRRLKESPFPNSYNTPSLARPADQDPLGLAP